VGGWTINVPLGAHAATWRNVHAVVSGVKDGTVSLHLRFWRATAAKLEHAGRLTLTGARNLQRQWR
jgi:hypothetical protein